MRISAQLFMRSFPCLGLIILAASLARSQEPSPRIKVSIKDGKAITDQSLPLDPTPRIRADYSSFPYFALILDDKNVTFNPQGILASARVDNQNVQNAFVVNGRVQQPQPLPPGPFGKKRLGTQMQWNENGIHFTRVIEIIPSKVTGTIAPGQKRRLDTVRISYLAENKDTREHLVEFRCWMDAMVGTNDGALFAAPTHPGKIIDGIVLKDKTLPEFLQILENPNLKNPGMVATLTLKFGGKVEGPNKVVLTNNLGITGGWDIAPQNAGGDSACALYWAPKKLKPGEKREMVWAHGGGVANNPENDGRVTLSLGGSFEPGKQFTILASVEDPAPGQMLTLELPAGMERVEGKERQPVPSPQDSGNSLVLWKVRVLQMGDHEVKVRSSTGVTQIKNISIQAAN